MSIFTTGKRLRQPILNTPGARLQSVYRFTNCLFVSGGHTRRAEVINGAADDISGVSVIDDYTLQVTLENPVTYF